MGKNLLSSNTSSNTCLRCTSARSALEALRNALYKFCTYLIIISCFIKIQNGSTFLAPAYPGCPGKKDKGVCLSVACTKANHFKMCLKSNLLRPLTTKKLNLDVINCCSIPKYKKYPAIVQSNILYINFILVYVTLCTFTSFAVILSLTRGAANIVKAVIPSTSRGTDSNRCALWGHYIPSDL